MGDENAGNGRQNLRYELISKTVTAWDCQCWMFAFGLKYLFLDVAAGLRHYRHRIS